MSIFHLKNVTATVAATLVALGVTTSVSVAAGATPQLAADNYPSRDVRIEVSFPPGGGTDILARLVGTPLSEILGRAVVVINKPGASGNIAARSVARAKADGHTLLMANSSYAVNPSVLKNLPFDPLSDLEGVVNFTYVSNALVVPMESPYQTVEEYAAAAKDKKVFYGSCGNGTTPHLAGELLKQQAAIDLVHVPFAGCGPAVAAVLANQVESAFVTTSSVMAHIDAGKVRVLALTAKEREAAFADIPTIAEAGYPDYELVQWHGLLAPKGTPADVKDKIATAVQEVLQQPEIQERLNALGYHQGGEGPADFDRIVKGDIQRYAEIIEGVEIKVD